MMTSASSLLAAALADGAVLVHTPTVQFSPSDFKSVLDIRLSQYFARHETPFIAPPSIYDSQRATASEAANVLLRIQHILGIETTTSSGEQEPLIGTRDLAQLRTLLSLVFTWGIEPLLRQVCLALPSASASVVGTSHFSDLSALTGDYRILSSLVTRTLSLLFPTGPGSKIPQTLISTTILNRHAVDVLEPSITLGWLPKSLTTEGSPAVDELRPTTLRLLSVLQPAQSIIALSAIISTSPPPHVQKACTFLLSRQLLRPDGVQGLCFALFPQEPDSNEDINTTLIERLEQFSRVLTAVPSGMDPQKYGNVVIPKLLSLLTEGVPERHTRAAAFALSRMIAEAEDQPHLAVMRLQVEKILHNPFLRIPLLYSSENVKERVQESQSNDAGGVNNPSKAVHYLTVLMLNADPSPLFITRLLSPIYPVLYSLLFYLDSTKVSDPGMRESLRGILKTWGKIVSLEEGMRVLWPIVEQEEVDEWNLNAQGVLVRSLRKETRSSSLSLLTPQDKNLNLFDADVEVDTNLFQQYPDPVHIVNFLKCLDRSDIASTFFVRLLETYRTSKAQEDENSMRILLHLQIIMQMQKQLSDSTSSNLMQNPANLLTFVKNILETSAVVSTTTSSSRATNPRTSTSSTLHTLRVVQEEEQNESGTDSDDDMPDSERQGPDDEMVETALNLLLSILEAHEVLQTENIPVLNDVFTLLEPYAQDASHSVRPVAREARMVITARLAAGYKPSLRARGTQHDSAQETYQKALKLLQDPLLPVRAHGLLLLRTLLSPSASGDKGEILADPALVPAILSIFMQSMHDDDSYIYLNAVQGLAGMVDRFGRDVLKTLVNDYAGGLRGLSRTNLTMADVDVRIKVGEALTTVVRRYGESLIGYDLIVPPLFGVLRARDAPTALRTSSIAVLAQCAETCALAILPYSEDLANALVDLLQIETVPVDTQGQVKKGDRAKEISPSEERPPPGENTIPKEPRTSKAQNQTGAIGEETLDSNPASTNAKLPPLRRAAIHFLRTIVREATRRIYNMLDNMATDSDSFAFTVSSRSHSSARSRSTSMPLSSELVRRMKVTLDYAVATDVDYIVRAMARETAKDLEDMKKAMIGLDFLA